MPPPCRYAAYIALFEPLLGASAPARPIQVDNAVKARPPDARCLSIAVWRVCLGPAPAVLLHRAPAPRWAPLLKPPRPSLLCARLQVGQKRGRSQLEELNAENVDGAKRKKVSSAG